MKQRRVAIVGTGTGIGKTHAACALLRAARLQGLDAVGLKPIESGVDGELGEDSLALAEAGARPLGTPPFRIREPISPHLAARRAGLSIELTAVTAWVGQQRSQLLFIETAGGLLSPLGLDMTNLDLVTALAPDAVLLISVDRLGVLHDVAATLLALRSAGIVPRAIALNAPEQRDASTGTNGAELEALHGVPVHVLPRALPGAPDTLESASRLLEQLA